MTKPNRVAVAALVNDLAEAHAGYCGGRVNALDAVCKPRSPAQRNAARLAILNRALSGLRNKPQ